VSEERREFQRLNLVRPLDGWFGDFAVRLLDLSARGALVESDEPIPPDSRALLRFWWRNEELEVTAEIARKADAAHAGLAFLEDNQMLRRLIAEAAAELLRAQEANAAGDRAKNFIGDETLTAASAGPRLNGFVTWTLVDGTWKRRISLLPDQPAEGFTISAAEPDSDVELLRKTYEAGDAESRKLTRMLAELSVAAAR